MTAPAPPETELSADDRRRLLLVATACFSVFALELVGGELARSQAVQADALDFAATGFAVLAVLKPLRPGMSLAVHVALAGLTGWMGLATFYRFLVQETPEPSLMAALGVAALAANGAILYLLRARHHQRRLGTFWERTINDSIGGATLVVAAGVVALLQNSVADLTVAGVMVVLAGSSVAPNLRDSWQQWRAGRPSPATERRSR